jgi:hypothetical protein
MGELFNKLMTKLHATNPYQDFDHKKVTEDLVSFEDPLVRHWIEKIQPKLIFEVGSWKGDSAIFMASLLKKNNVDGAVVCIDTWLGSLEHLMGMEHPYWSMSRFRQHGYPTLYYQFLANVKHRGLQDYIIPLPNTSTIGARWLLSQKIQADLIYIDASHDELDVYLDLVNYWKVLKPGGVMLGDDMCADWPGVISAVSRFVKEQNLSIEVLEPKWAILKK